MLQHRASESVTSRSSSIFSRHRAGGIQEYIDADPGDYECSFYIKRSITGREAISICYSTEGGREIF
jgi:hypothetical protein